MHTLPGSTAGFTLVELLIALSLIAILSTLALPDFREIVAAKQGEKALSRLSHALSLARIHAIRSGRLVTVCPSREGLRCGGEWQQGILVLSDRNGDRELNQDDEVVYYLHGFGTGGSLRWRAFQNRRYLQITPLGFTRYQNGNFTWCPADGDARFARQLIVNRAARVRIAPDRDGDGVREDSRGRPLRC